MHEDLRAIGENGRIWDVESNCGEDEVFTAERGNACAIADRIRGNTAHSAVLDLL